MEGLEMKNKGYIAIGVLSLAFIMVSASLAQEIEGYHPPSDNIIGNLEWCTEVTLQNTPVTLSLPADTDKTVAKLVKVKTNRPVVVQGKLGTDGKLKTSGYPSTSLPNALKLGLGAFTPISLSGAAQTISATIGAIGPIITTEHDGHFIQTLVGTESSGSYKGTLTVSYVVPT